MENAPKRQSSRFSSLCSLSKAFLFLAVAFLSFVVFFLLLRDRRSGNLSQFLQGEAELQQEVTTTELPPDEVESNCGRSATVRGPGQRVVSFSFYGAKNNTRRYFQGIEANAQLVAEIYPGWSMRVYHDMDADDADLQRLVASFPHLDLCDVRHLPRIGNVVDTHPMMWRFLPLCDPLADVVLSRDLDSRVSLREKAAVDEWLVSGLNAHVMRDTPYHRVPVLGGMWGARLGDEKGLRRLCPKLTDHAARNKGYDQQVLWKVLWPAVKNDVLQHDAYSCLTFNTSHGNAHAWPTKRPETTLNFVGSREGVDVNPWHEECPEACRPRHHKDWTYC